MNQWNSEKRSWTLAMVFLCTMLMPGFVSAYNATRTIGIPSSGNTMTFTFANIPRSASNVSVKVDLYGDYNSSTEYADVSIDGTNPANNRINPDSGQCNTSITGTNSDNTRTFTVPATTTNDNSLTVVVTNSSAVSHATCANISGSNQVVVTVRYTDATLPDLDIVTSTAPNPAGNVTIGAPFNISLGFRNVGTAALTPSYRYQMFYCPTATPTGCVLLRTSTTSLDLAVNQLRTYNQSNLVLPQSAQPGTRYIRTVVDSSNQISELRESNNDDYDAINVVLPTTPDLIITSSTAPVGATSVPAGGNITVDVSIRNVGLALTQNFSIQFSHCPGNNDNNCQIRNTLAVTDNFAAGQIRRYTVTFTTVNSAQFPAGIDYIRTVVDSGNTVGEGTTGETNNKDFDGFSLTKPTRPDLYVGASSAPVGTAYVAWGNQVTVNYTIVNQGANLTPSFAVSLYHCPNNNTTGCTLGATRIISDDFAPSQSRQYTNTFTLPNGTGNASDYVRIFVDSRGAITEQNENNNNRYDFISIRPPDLFFSTSTAPSNSLGVSPGAPITFTYTIRNSSVGGAVTDSFYVRHYYCRTASTANCSPISTSVLITSNFISGQTRNYVRTYTLPATAVIGLGYIRTFVDSLGNRIVESSETNNNDYDAITVESPDPEVTASTAPSPATVTSVSPGGSIKVDYTIRNNTGHFTTNFTVTIFYCPNNNATGCVSVATRPITDNFTRRQSRNYTNTFNLPANAQAGTRYIRFQVDSANTITEGTAGEANNNRYDPITVTTPPDLQVTSLTANPTAGAPGSSATLQFRVANLGGSNAGAAKVRFYWSADSSITTADTYLGVERSYTLAAGQSLPSATTTYSVSVTIPAAASGAGFLGALIDYDTQVAESNENNNGRSAAFTVNQPQPDLVATSATPNPTSALPGAQINVAYKVDNSGNAAVASYAIRFYFSTNQTVDAADTTLSTVTQTNIAAGSSQTGNATITLPSTLAGAAGYILMFVDHNTAVAESNENNNVSSSAFTVLTDQDKDGVPSTVDCADDDKERFPAYNGKPANPEVCDGKDNDCNNLVDDGLTCTEPKTETPVDAGAPDTPVVDAPAGDTPPGDTPGDCFQTGCPTGQICVAGKCTADPCGAVQCNNDEVCKAGNCVKICGCTRCATNEVCDNGTCVTNKCAGVTCMNGEFCNPADGKCATDNCSGVNCNKGRVCNPADGKCIDDPCNNISCPSGNECKGGQCVGLSCGENAGEVGPDAADAGTTDTGTADNGSADNGGADNGTVDNGTVDNGTVDNGGADNGGADTGTTDNGTTDNGTVDTGKTDNGAADTGAADTGSADTGKTTDTGGADTNTGGADKSAGNDNGGSTTDTNTPPPGGCCEMGNAGQAPFVLAFMLLLFILLPNLRRRKQ